MPTNQYHPTPEERDERVSLPLPPEEAIAAILATGPHPDEVETPAEDQPGPLEDRTDAAH